MANNTGTFNKPTKLTFSKNGFKAINKTFIPRPDGTVGLSTTYYTREDVSAFVETVKPKVPEENKDDYLYFEDFMTNGRKFSKVSGKYVDDVETIEITNPIGNNDTSLITEVTFEGNGTLFKPFGGIEWSAFSKGQEIDSADGNIIKLETSDSVYTVNNNNITEGLKVNEDTIYYYGTVTVKESEAKLTVEDSEGESSGNDDDKLNLEAVEGKLSKDNKDESSEESKEELTQGSEAELTVQECDVYLKLVWNSNDSTLTAYDADSNELYQWEYESNNFTGKAISGHENDWLARVCSKLNPHYTTAEDETGNKTVTVTLKYIGNVVVTSDLTNSSNKFLNFNYIKYYDQVVIGGLSKTNG